MRRLAYLSLLVLTLAAPATPAKTLAEFKFDTPAQEQAFRDLTGQLRCLVCQNESLAASQADLAEDLRREVYEMMRSGKSKQDIIKYLVARYGDFVLYKPPLKPSTYPLWYGPLLLVAVGSFFLGRTLLRKRRSRDNDLNEAERARLQALLAAQSTSGEDKK